MTRCAILTTAALALLAGCGSESGRRLATATDGCTFSFPKAGLCAAVEWATPPASKKKTSATLRFFKNTGTVKSGPFVRPDADVHVPSPQMPSMGHDSGEDPTTKPVAGTASDYQVENVYFNMRGRWTVDVELRKGGKVVERATLTLRL